MYGGTTDRTRSPLIGRGAQLEALERLYHRAVNGESAVALLWGEAGIGKTRLLDEFSLRARGDGAQVGAAACFESLCPPFAPLREAFNLLSIPEPFAAPDDAPRAFSAAARYRAMLDAAESFKRTAVTPLVLTIDDLQWADFASLEFLAFLTPRLANTRALILAAVRSEQLERDHVRREALDRLTREGAITIAIPPLNDDEMHRLVSGILPEAAPNRSREIDRICELADGKPYFAEELVNSAASSREGSKFEVTPLSIRAGVLARFEQLPAEERRILLYASVIGRSFDAALLAEVSQSSHAAVAGALTRARDLQLVRETRENPGAFTFRHAITREILYRELLAFESQAIHREVAERLTGISHAGPFDLAYHWNAAGDRQRASEAYERAGDSALARNAHRDAEIAYRGAVESRDPTNTGYPMLCEKLSRALSANGEVDEACAFYERAVHAYVAAGATHQAATLALRLARRIYESGRPQQAAAAARQALELSDERGPVAYDAYVTLAHFEALQGRNGAAVEHLAAAERTPGEHAATDRRNAHMVRAIVAATSRRLTEAFEDYEAAVAIARELSDAEQLAWTLNNYASRAMVTGWTDRALAAHREAADCLRRNDFGKVGASTVQGLAFGELLAGNLEAVRALQREDEQLPPGIAMTQTARAALGIRLAYYCAEDAEAARLATPQALELAFASGETQRIGLLAGSVAAFYDVTGRSDEAVALRSRALQALNTVDFSFWLLDQLAASPKLGERDAARALLADAAIDPAHRAAQAHLALFDALLARLRRSADAKTHALVAAGAFEAIGWPWERAQSLEIAGRYAEALAIYRRHGFVRHALALERSRRRLRHRAETATLTPRELEVARLAAEGKSNRSIAAELFIGERTVETHIAAIFDRFDLTSRRELAALLDKLESCAG